MRTLLIAFALLTSIGCKHPGRTWLAGFVAGGVATAGVSAVAGKPDVCDADPESVQCSAATRFVLIPAIFGIVVASVALVMHIKLGAEKGERERAQREADRDSEREDDERRERKECQEKVRAERKVWMDTVDRDARICHLDCEEEVTRIYKRECDRNLECFNARTPSCLQDCPGTPPPHTIFDC